MVGTPVRQRNEKLEALEEGKCVIAAELLHYGFAKALGEHVLEFGHLAGIGEERGYCGAVPVAAECDGVLTAQVEPVLDMGRQLVEGDICSGLVGGLVRKELAAVVKADNAALIEDGAELVVGEVALDAADGAGVRVAGHKGARGTGGNLVKA